MNFTSFQTFWLLPLIFLLYHRLCSVMKAKYHLRWSNLLLLAISYLLYMQWNIGYLLVLLWVTWVTYAGALMLEDRIRHRKLCLWLCVLLGISPLALFKYYDFVISSIGAMSSCFGSLPGLNWAIPVGISFYTFQAVGYLADVYHKRVRAERNLGDYALFVAFFPQVLSGPISKADELLPQIKAPRPFNQPEAVMGLRYMLWGLFMKVVVADRLSEYVSLVYQNYEFYSSLTCAAAACLYSIQIYCDFAGYSLMAVGTGRLFGFRLVQNFRRPYFACSITDFWRRWHISLTRWLTTHVYIAMGGSRRGRWRTYVNILLTFLVSGIWHGANWTFIVWGLLHGLFQIIEKSLGIDKSAPATVLSRLLRCAIVFVLTSYAWIWFRSPDLATAVDFSGWIFGGHGWELFLPSSSILAYMLIGLCALAIKECSEEFFPRVQAFSHPNRVVRWITYVALCILILLTGVFDAGQFIYVQF